MQRQELNKSDLHTKLKNLLALHDEVTANINGDAYIKLHNLHMELEDFQENPSDDPESLKKINNCIAQYEELISAQPVVAQEKQADAPALLDAGNTEAEPEQEEELDEDVYNYIANDNLSFKITAEHLRTFTNLMVVSATDRLKLDKLAEENREFRSKLLQTQTTLDNLLHQSHAHNQQLSNENANNFKSRLRDTQSFLRDVQEAEKNIEACRAAQDKFGFYNAPEADSDVAAFYPLAEATNCARAYLARNVDRGQLAAFQIVSNATSRFMGHVTNISKNPEAGNARFVPSTIIDDKKHLHRYALTQSHDEATQSFQTHVWYENFPTNINRIKNSFFSSLSIPGLEVMKFAHDTIENHRMMNKFYPDAVLNLNLRTAPKEIAEAMDLYCRYKGYPYKIIGEHDLDKSDTKFAFLKSKLGLELDAMTETRLNVLDAPQPQEKSERQALRP